MNALSDMSSQDWRHLISKEDFLALCAQKNISKKDLAISLQYFQDYESLKLPLLEWQNGIIQNKKRVLIIFEGRDASGKGGAIKRITDVLNPKKSIVKALPKPSEIEKAQWYFQRYLLHLPNEGEVVFFDRSWYNRAAVEPIFGFCSKTQYESFMQQVVLLERMLVESGIHIIKFFLDIDKETQAHRLVKREKDPLKHWKIGILDKQAQEKWDDYSLYLDAMLKQTTHKTAPWVVVESKDKKKTRLACISYLLSVITYDRKTPNTFFYKEIIDIKK